VDEDAVGVLEAEGEGRACNEEDLGQKDCLGVGWSGDGVRMSLQEEGIFARVKVTRGLLGHVSGGWDIESRILKDTVAL
jgi:hypothetical protein